MTSNAQIVVENWRKGDHSRAWNEPAGSMTPSAVNELAAAAFAKVAREADRQADDLVALGFMRSHSVVSTLRAIASDAARQNQRLVAWATDLAEAEQATMEETP